MTRITIDHDEIRRWAEHREARPFSVPATGGVRLAPLRSEPPLTEPLEPIGWEQFFDIFEEQRLALLYEQERDSEFAGFLDRDAMEGRVASA